MQSRAETWRKYLIGNNDTIHQRRKLFYNVINTFPYSIPLQLESLITKDMPRTSFEGSDWFDDKENMLVIESLLHQYVSIMPCDGYLQGFGYLMSLLYYVFSRHDKEHSIPDSWWAFSSILSIIRPTIPDHDPEDFLAYTKIWQKHYVLQIKQTSNRTHTWLTPFYDVILPTMTVKWLMVWFSQQFNIDDIVYIWDALITCESSQRTKLMAVIAANITIQHSSSIEYWAEKCPSEIGPRLMCVKAKDGKVIIENSRNAMLQYSLPGL